jgi:DNA-binding transcriptional LysR family regulator
MDLLKARAKSLAGGCEPELTVVVDAIFPIAMLTGAIAALQVQFPETSLRLYVEGSGASVQHVLDRRCAVGVVVSHMSTPPQLARERLMTVKMAMVVSPKHPLAAYGRPIPINGARLCKSAGASASALKPKSSRTRCRCRRSKVAPPSESRSK